MIALTFFAFRLTCMTWLVRAARIVLPESERQHFDNSVKPYLDGALGRLIARRNAWTEELRRNAS